MTALAVATKVRVGTTTSSPGPTPSISRARWRAAVPLESASGGGRADRGRELLFERVDVRAERRDPVGVERVEQQRSLLRAHVGRREIEARWLVVGRVVRHRGTVPGA